MVVPRCAAHGHLDPPRVDVTDDSGVFPESLLLSVTPLPGADRCDGRAVTILNYIKWRSSG